MSEDDINTPPPSTHVIGDDGLLKDANSWYSAAQLEEIEGIPTNGTKPEGLDETLEVAVKYEPSIDYKEGRWVKGRPMFHQWSLITHYRPQTPSPQPRETTND
jgi:hypothetical protein